MSDTVLVTGGNRGIGLAICSQLGREGYRVLMGCRNPEQAEGACRQLQGGISPVFLDLSQLDNIGSQVDDIVNQHGIIHGLINNAGILREGNLIEVARDDFYLTLQTNLHAPFELCRALLPMMLANDYGRIVNVTSSWGAFNQGMEGPAAYSVSKAALNALTLSLSRDLPQNIKVNAMDPGWVKTDMGGDEAPTSPEHAAQTAVFLISLDKSGPSGKFFRDKREIPW